MRQLRNAPSRHRISSAVVNSCCPRCMMDCRICLSHSFVIPATYFMKSPRIRGRLRTVIQGWLDVDPLDLVERDLLTEAIIQLGGEGGLVPGNSGRDLEVAAVPKVLGDPGPAEAVGADLGR